MRRGLALTAGGALAATIALAAADIPTRYVGAFPSTQLSTNITGVFTGNALTLKYTFKRGLAFIQTTANYSCVVAKPNRTDCKGRFESDDGRYGGRSEVQVTWKAGQPVKLHFGKSKM
jgi:hypothetical protein